MTLRIEKYIKKIIILLLITEQHKRYFVACIFLTTGKKNSQLSNENDTRVTLRNNIKDTLLHVYSSQLARKILSYQMKMTPESQAQMAMYNIICRISKKMLHVCFFMPTEFAT